MAVDIDTVVVGAGVIGLAVARIFAMSGRDVLIIEKSDGIGRATSSRNSEVIHAGIYYEPGSLKSQLCVTGKQLLYQFCAASGVEARAIGKLIVALTPSEIPKLKALQATAVQNGVDDLQWLSGADAAKLEPELNCVAALHSPSTGIIDSQGYMLALQANAETHGATLALRTSVQSGACGGDGFVLILRNADGTTSELTTRTVINCAGHGAHAVATNLKGYVDAHLPPQFFAKGSYCNVSGKSPFSHLIYPIPVAGALGIHLTLDMQGKIRLGPNIEWVAEEDYSVSHAIETEFARACESFWPELREREISSAYSGVRPKIHGPATKWADFMIQGPSTHNVRGLVNLFGIESPGLTASLAIAEHVLKVVDADA